ncbi:MGMT family protein [Rhodohalobacter barkolensis]|uniref:Methylated-DNA-[protein]-cysteine S-methyltransferase DNA binding domain-containing protein n=1 Tax=Rhodohalobacter barkolensis TaxID=2053187 RepID=A0A2N0VIX3_9BACT|nr:MGMT family protein [Rhodohalobacter barkolensis]PKD44088.1 hypothetical protein CWD77_01040 [Rhodohalobacter barkolensis]
MEYIPQGRMTTHGAIAKCMGVASGAHMVGYALNQLVHEHEDQPLPTHSVVNRLGQLTARG